MKHRERVLMALHHEPPDRCPMQISFTPEFASRLRLDLLHKTGAAHNPHGGGNTYELERALDEDMLLTSVGWANSYYQEAGNYADEWGIEWKQCEYTTRYGKGSYTEMATHPLARDAALENYRPPDPTRPELYQDAARTLREFKDEYWIVGVTMTTIFECAWGLRGLEQMLADFALNPEIAERILDIPYHFHLAAAKRLVEMGVDMVWTGDDVGAQHSMIISPDCWRKYLKPRMANFIAELKAINPQVKVAYHSDGMIVPIIPELIEIGVDVLNPIQPASMDPAEIKRQFGNRLCFLGMHRRATHPALWNRRRGSPGGRGETQHHWKERRSDPGPHSPRATGYPHGELLGHGADDDGDFYSSRRSTRINQPADTNVPS